MSEPAAGARAGLLALTSIKGVSWSVIAREAQRDGALDRLLSGHVSEGSAQAKETAALIREESKRIPELRSRAEETIAEAAEAGARLVTVLDDDYPSNLRVIYNLPPFLFYRGQLRTEDALAVSVVGTRNPSDDGVKRARRMARELHEKGVTVLSGLAKGIDTAAHTATLEADGRTIAVMGTGIVAPTYPKENAALAERIAEAGALVSQFWPTSPPLRGNFPLRNIVMSGLGQGTVVIEATHTSGARLQARRALEHGKQVFLVKSLVTDQAWARTALERGAIEIESAEDVTSRLRSVDEVSELTQQRRQLVLGLN